MRDIPFPKSLARSLRPLALAFGALLALAAAPAQANPPEGAPSLPA